MRLLHVAAISLVLLVASACSKGSIETAGLGARSTDFFRYEYNSNYYRSPKPYFTLYIFPSGENLAIGSFYQTRGGQTFAFKYRGSSEQLADLKAILEEHEFGSIEGYLYQGGPHMNHSPTYTVQIVHAQLAHEVVWQTGFYERKERAKAIKPIIQALEEYLNIEKIIEQFEREREKYEGRQ